LAKARELLYHQQKGTQSITVVQRRKEQGNTPTGTGGDGAGAFNAKTDGHGVSNNTKWSTPITNKQNKSLRSANNKDGKNKKPRSDDKDSGGEESKQRREGSEEKVGQGDFTVDLELMSALLKKKSLKTKAAKEKADKKRQEDSTEKTTRRKRRQCLRLNQTKQVRKRTRKRWPSASNV
jgi:hypothetical protein